MQISPATAHHLVSLAQAELQAPEDAVVEARYQGALAAVVVAAWPTVDVEADELAEIVAQCMTTAEDPATAEVLLVERVTSLS